MNAIRVHFGPMPKMLRSIMGDLLQRESDIIIVGTSSQRGDCLLAARQAGAEILIVQDAAPGGEACLDLVLAEPALGLFALSADGHSAAEVRLARRPIKLGGDSPSNLAEAIREMAAGQRASNEMHAPAMPGVQETGPNRASEPRLTDDQRRNGGGTT